MPGGTNQANRDLAAVALACGKSLAEAATAAGVTERTVLRWKKDPPFKTRVEELRADIVRDTAGQLASSMTRAAEVLDTLLKSANERVQLTAATQIIELGLKVTELSELQKRIEDLELTGPVDPTRRGDEPRAECAKVAIAGVRHRTRSIRLVSQPVVS